MNSAAASTSTDAMIQRTAGFAGSALSEAAVRGSFLDRGAESSFHGS
jgi:hypothetical protein